ncbi:imidazoleglycerol-phosphate dehydratase [candidate division MSBL1 archaeon SCGC-AAA261F19]|uniref:Imidazoleglycerol-phosphate dehydratase n=1 Tax=candidate division MSBL1 archaeon SCGC-AAA261F19 TaxID=1698275 RepID=A0A133VA71_9EURY|nr:imidazoleglycerol-phosphate dehydratase [candidate division MSBL1 archaeon SCGC-AAA261F19]
MRESKVKRETKETTIDIRIGLEGSGKAEVQTGISFFNHLLESFAKHGRFDIKAKSLGDFKHHIAEDTMIALGTALDEALGDRKGIRRMGDAIVPMDDALALVAVDLGGRVYSKVEVDFTKKRLDDLSSDLLVHLLETFASNAKLNLHVKLMRGDNDHHKAEAIFKALGVALSEAVSLTGVDEVPSAKGVI